MMEKSKGVVIVSNYSVPKEKTLDDFIDDVKLKVKHIGIVKTVIF